MVFVRGKRPTLKSLIRVLIFTNIYIILVAIINFIIGTNYLFLNRKPDAASIVDFLGPWPWSTIAMEGVIIISFIILYIPYLINDKIYKFIKT